MTEESFQRIRRIGRGGMGTVYLARHRQDRTPVAMKLLTTRNALDPLFQRLFENEARAVAALHHPAIIQILDFGRTGEDDEDDNIPAGTPWIVMELARGGALGSGGRTLPWPTLRGVIMLMLDALAHAHARGVIHRDLKPENILVATTADLRPGLKLTDFGIAHLMGDEEAPEEAAMAGTPAYMAPEQFFGQREAIGPWTDLYALGIVIYQLALGYPPYLESSTVALAMQHQKGRWMPVETLRGDLPAGFDTWLRRLIHPEVGERFQCAADAGYSLTLLDPATRTDPVLRGSLVALGEPRLEIPPTQLSPTVTTSPDRNGRPPEARSGRPSPEPHTLQRTLAAWAEEGAAGPERPGDATQINPEGAADADDAATLLTPPDWSHIERARAAAPDITPCERHRPPLPDSWQRGDEEPLHHHLQGVGLGLFGLRPVPLVGRHHERDLIWQKLAEVHESGTPQTLVLRGPSGCGKSRLAEWITQRAEEVGAAGGMRAVHGPVPSPEDGLEAMLRRHPVAALALDARPDEPFAALLHELSPGERQQLSVMFKDNEEHDPGFGRIEERWHVVGRLLAALARPRPILVWLDDAQWGSDCIGFADHVMQAADDIPVLFLLTVRDEALQEGGLAARRLLELLGRDNVQAMPLGPLERGEMTRLVQQHIGLEHAASARVAMRAAGNPLFAVQLVGDWVRRGVLVPGSSGFRVAPGTQLELPPDVGAVWRSHLQQIATDFGEPGLMALQLAAVLGQEVNEEEWSALCHAAGQPIPDGLLHALHRQRLARGAGEGWSFAHGMLREVLEDDARHNETWAKDNALCASVLEKRYRSIGGRNRSERLGRHLMQAGRFTEAASYLIEAAAAAEHRSDCGLALNLLDDAERALSRIAQEQQYALRSRLGALRASVQLLQRDAAGAQLSTTMALDCADALNADHLRAEALLQEGNRRRLASDNRGSEEVLRDALALFTRVRDDHGRARTLRSLAWAEVLQARLTDAREHAQQALELFEALGDMRGQAGALRTLGDVARNRDDHASAEELFTRARDVFDGIGNIAGVSECVHGIAECRRLLGDFAAAEEGYRKTIELDRSYGCNNVTVPRINLCLVQIAQGEYEEPRRTLEQLIGKLRSSRESGDRGYMHFMAGVSCAGQGDWTAFDMHMDAANRALEASGYVDLDLAMYGEIAMDLAREANEFTRAERARSFAVLQWRRLGHARRAEGVAALPLK